MLYGFPHKLFRFILMKRRRPQTGEAGTIHHAVLTFVHGGFRELICCACYRPPDALVDEIATEIGAI